MKRIFILLFLILLLQLSANAAILPDFEHKNIRVNTKITYDTYTEKWSNKVDKKNTNYFTKTKDNEDSFEYISSDNSYIFSTDCDFEFIINGSLIGYSNKDLKFYEFYYNNGEIIKRAMIKEEVQELFPKYKIITPNDFSTITNSLKIKKGANNFKLIFYNNTDNTFDNYIFSTGNARIETYCMNGFVSVSKKGMIQFSKANENSDKNPWYIILVR